jgi:hypothetical protein
MGVLDKFYSDSELEVTAPSGITYRVRAISAMEFSAAMGAIPSMAKGGAEAPSDVIKNLEMQRHVAAAGIVSMAYRNESEEGSPDPGRLPTNDVAVLFNEVWGASGFAGSEADLARRVVPESANGARPGRAGAKVRRDPVGVNG